MPTLIGDLSVLEIVGIVSGIFGVVLLTIDFFRGLVTERKILSGIYSKEQLDALIAYRKIKYEFYHDVLWKIYCLLLIVIVLYGLRVLEVIKGTLS